MESSDYVNLNIYSLNETSEKKILQRRSVFEEILKKCHYKIVSAAKKTEMRCIFHIPNYVAGMPIFDSEACKVFLVNRLKNELFDVIYFQPNILFISWEKTSYKVNPDRLIHYSDKAPKLRTTHDKLQIQSIEPPKSMELNFLEYPQPERRIVNKNKIKYVNTGTLF